MPAEATRGTSRWLCSSRWLGTSCCGLSACSPQGKNRESPEQSEGRREPRRHRGDIHRETDMVLGSLFPRKLGNTSNRGRKKNLPILARLLAKKLRMLGPHEARGRLPPSKQMRRAALQNCSGEEGYSTLPAHSQYNQ